MELLYAVLAVLSRIHAQPAPQAQAAWAHLLRRRGRSLAERSQAREAPTGRQGGVLPSRRPGRRRGRLVAVGARRDRRMAARRRLAGRAVHGVDAAKC